MRKRILLAFISLVFTVCAACLLSLTTSALTSGYYTYTTSGNTATITSVSTSVSGDITVPAKLGSYTVTEIGTNAFAHCSNLTGITVPNGVKSIGDSAFYYCKGLEYVNIPSSVTSIGKEVFGSCIALESINVDIQNTVYGSDGNCLIDKGNNTLIAGCKNSTIPDDGSVTAIAAYAFSGVQELESIVIPDTVTSIGERAFYYCYALKYVVIPDSVTFVGAYAFQQTQGVLLCAEHTSKPSGWSSYWNYANDTVVWGYEGMYTDSYGVTYALSSDKMAAVVGFDNSSSDVVLGVDGYTLCTIRKNAFEDCSSLVSITIPEGIGEIGENTFAGCSSLKEISVPSGVVTIRKLAFYGCYALKTVSIPSSVEKIENYAFGYGGSSFTVYAEARSKPDGWDTKWLPSGASVVWDMKGVVTDASGVTYALKGDNTCIALSFDGSGSEIVLGYRGYTLTEIASRAFYDCQQLTDVTIPDGVITIGERAFENCKNLKHVILPQSVEYIGERAFASCYFIESVEIYGAPVIASCAFGWVISDPTIIFYQTPQSIYDDSYTIYDNYLIRCYGDNDKAIAYAEKYSRALSLLPCKEGCAFELEIADDRYLLTVPTCTQKAVYGKSCVCGALSETETFEGDYLHSYTNYDTSDMYKKSDATCTDAAVYYLSCECSAVSDLTFKSGTALGHDICAATCTENEYCRRCREVLSDPLGHSPIVDAETDVEICERCGLARYCIVYDANGGSNPPAEQSKWHGETLYIVSDVPVRSGHVFVGWATSPHLNVQYKSGDTITDDASVTLYAMWMKICTTCSGDGKYTERVDCSSCIDGYNYKSEDCPSCTGGRIPYETACPLAYPGGASVYGYCHNGTYLQGEGYAPRVCSSCGGDGSVTKYKTCSTCSGSGSVTYSSYCSSCSGYGYKNVNKSCTDCAQTGYLKLTPSAPTVPAIAVKGDDFVVLLWNESCEYSKDGVNWQSSNAFYSLSSGEHTFYMRYKATDTTNASAASSLSLTIGKIGDVDGDGDVSNADITLLVRYLSGWDVIGVNIGNADLTHDKKINNRDVIALVQKVSGWY